MITVSIPMPEYLHRYLMTKAIQEQGALRFHRKSEYNLLLIRLVGNYGKVSPTKPTDCKIILPTNEIKDVRSYNKLSEHDMEHFKEKVKEDFYYEYFRFVMMHLKQGQCRKEATYQFLEKLNFPDGVNKFDALYKAFTRKQHKFIA